MRLEIWTLALQGKSLIAFALSRVHTSNKATRNKIATSVKSVQTHVLKRWFELGKQADYRESLPELSAPLLLIYGKRDPYAKSYQEDFYSRVTRVPVQFVYIDGVGHQVPTKRSNELNAILRQFAKNVGD
ncbi:alpha/beta hydrolase [Salicibibacter cibi]|uniref:Alpha/beta hydrolase n=1 Tax=Salicibibacter cibi TaxID=2743001 RepID=A0A7T7CH37_9BACI|nr:alpha/beta hydrolase [Salicibibacter cibi]QQK81689.1 alpha/beta hydrolase [Salicibibacter cibi]